MPERAVASSGWFGIPTSALAALPACPACYPAYAGILSALGLGGLANVPAQAALTVLLLIGALVSLAYGARSRRGLGPFALGAAASVGVVVFKFLVGWEPGIYAGVGVLILAGVWNVWPRRDNECDACVDSPEGVDVAR